MPDPPLGLDRETVRHRGHWAVEQLDALDDATMKDVPSHGGASGTRAAPGERASDLRATSSTTYDATEEDIDMLIETVRKRGERLTEAQRAGAG